MDQPGLPYPKRRLYIADWSSRTLHAVAMLFNRERAERDLSERQEWLYDRIVEELEWRWLEDIRVRPWAACSCLLCFSPFPTADPDDEGDEEGPQPSETRPEGRPISHHHRQRPAEN